MLHESRWKARKRAKRTKALLLKGMAIASIFAVVAGYPCDITEHAPYLNHFPAKEHVRASDTGKPVPIQAGANALIERKSDEAPAHIPTDVLFNLRGGSGSSPHIKELSSVRREEQEPASSSERAAATGGSPAETTSKSESLLLDIRSSTKTVLLLPASPSSLVPSDNPPAPGKSPLRLSTGKMDHGAEDLTFGSSIILQSCWQPRDLQGNPTEKTISKLKVPNGSIPADLKPVPCSRLSPLPEWWHGSIRRVEPSGNRRIVALTFDFCEQANDITGYDAEIVDYLRANQIKATFFAGGKWMASHPERTMQLMADPLFEIGNHAWTHGNLRVIHGERMQEQILATQIQYEILRKELGDRHCVRSIDPCELELIPKAPHVFRFPYGTCSTEVG